MVSLTFFSREQVAYISVLNYADTQIRPINRKILVSRALAKQIWRKGC